MSRPLPENLHVQLVPIDHECLFSVVLYAYERALRGADRGLLHRAALALSYRADPDEVNRLRQLQRRIAGLRGGGDAAIVAELEGLIGREYGRERNAQALAALPLIEVKAAGARWCAAGKRGLPVRISPELIGLLHSLFPDERASDGFPTWLEGSEEPRDQQGVLVLPADSSGQVLTYRPPEAVIEIYKQLSFLTRDTLDEAISSVVGDGDEAEETATWLEADFETLTGRYEVAAAGRFGLHFRYR